MNSYFLGIDVGSVSTNLVLMDDCKRIYKKLYLRTMGQPIKALKEGLESIRSDEGNIEIIGAGTTGSGRQLAAVITGADVVKNEITAHAIAALETNPDVKTVFEIGGQDSKIIILRDGIISDFAMNTVCAAGTGSFLDRQAARLNIPIKDFGGYALQSTVPVRIAGRCAVFAESDMIHKQQTGQRLEDIINGLCLALVRNYLNNLAKGKPIADPILFQGGVAANIGIVNAFQQELNAKVIVPEYYDVMGAYGAALLAREEMRKKQHTSFAGFDMAERDFSAKSFECTGCPNACEVVEIVAQSQTVARWGDRCGRWNNIKQERPAAATTQPKRQIKIIAQ